MGQDAISWWHLRPACAVKRVLSHRRDAGAIILEF
jgi:hypothetical protein